MCLVCDMWCWVVEFLCCCRLVWLCLLSLVLYIVWLVWVIRLLIELCV